MLLGRISASRRSTGAQQVLAHDGSDEDKAADQVVM
jgi:hypothetical protein